MTAAIASVGLFPLEGIPSGKDNEGEKISASCKAAYAVRCYYGCFELAPCWAIIGSGVNNGEEVRYATAGVAATDAVNAVNDVTSEVPRRSDLVDGGSDEEETCIASVETTSAAALAGCLYGVRDGNTRARGVVLRPVQRLLLLLLLQRRWDILASQAMSVENTIESR